MGETKKPAKKVRPKTAGTRKRSADRCETDLRQAQERLRKSEANLKKAEKIAKLGNWEWNILTNEIIWSDEVYRIYGIDPATDKPSFEVVIQAVAPEDRDRFVKSVEDAVKRGTHFEGEYRMIGLDGTERFTHTIGEVVRDPGGRPLSMFGVVQNITRRRKVEDSLRKAERLYQELVETAQDLIWQCDTEGRYTYVNGAWETVLNYRFEEMLGKKFSDFQDPETAKRDMEMFSRLLQAGAVSQYETVHRAKDGRAIHLVFNAKFVQDEHGKVIGTRGTAYDITERKRAEEKYRSLVETTNTGYVIIDDSGVVMDANQEYMALTGRTRRDEIIGHNVLEWTAPYEKERNAAAVRTCIDQGYIRNLEIDYLGIAGRAIPVEINATVLRSEGSISILSLCRDITERRKADEALRKREKQLAESQRIAHVGSWEHNITTGKAFWSDELFRILGLDPRKDPADFNMFFDMIHPDDRPILIKGIDETVRTGKQFSVDYRFILRDGRTRILHAQAELMHDETGTQNILSGTGQDITERKENEEKLRQSEQFVRNILDTVDEGFIVIDRDYRILTANKAYCGQVNLPCDDIIGKHCFTISHKFDRPCYEEGEECAVRQAFATGLPQTVFHKHSDHEGHVLFVETKGFPVKDASGNIISVIETINNITEKHLLEEERLKTQKLESIGTLAGGIAHDFNNLLQGIFGYISMAKMTYDQKEKSLEMLGQAEKALHLSVNLTSQLLTFSKGGKPVRKRISLLPVIENAAKFALSGSRSDFRLDIAPDLWQVDADAGQLAQVMQNIVLNADQAMPLGGSIVITARNLFGADPELPQGIERKDQVIIEIRDGGVGIAEEYLGKIFDPYFTTKEKGSGLGLATSYSIIKNHGGLIRVRSELGKGSVFSLYLPALAAVEAAPVKSAVPAGARKGRVLIMDDEEIVRLVAGELITTLGHEAEFAEHGEAALQAYRNAKAAGRPFDIVILDLTIRGGMGGAETVRKLLEIDPDAKTVVSSGYSDDLVTSTYRKHGFRAFLKKPYDVTDLQAILNALLV